MREQKPKVDAHQEAVTLVERSVIGQDPVPKKHAQAMLATLRGQLAAAQNLVNAAGRAR